MIDLLTVVFRDELPILKVQAQSVDLYCQDLNLKTIYVIVNDDDIVTSLIDANWWGSMSSKVKIIPRSIFSIGWIHPSGWISQQVFKMVGASLSYSDWTLILDAKTIFVKPINYSELVTSATISKQSTLPIHPAWKDGDFHMTVNSLFDIQLDCSINPNGVPFLFHNNTIRAMIGDISKLTNERFDSWFQRQVNPSEFLLYAAYLKYLHGTVDSKFNNNTSMYGVCNVSHDEFDNYNHIINQIISNYNLLTVSIHREAWKKLTLAQKQTYINFLVSKNITTARELA